MRRTLKETSCRKVIGLAACKHHSRPSRADPDQDYRFRPMCRRPLGKPSTFGDSKWLSAHSAAPAPLGPIGLPLGHEALAG